MHTYFPTFHFVFQQKFFSLFFPAWTTKKRMDIWCTDSWFPDALPRFNIPDSSRCWTYGTTMACATNAICYQTVPQQSKHLKIGQKKKQTKKRGNVQYQYDLWRWYWFKFINSIKEFRIFAWNKMKFASKNILRICYRNSNYCSISPYYLTFHRWKVK